MLSKKTKFQYSSVHCNLLLLNFFWSFTCELIENFSITFYQILKESSTYVFLFAITFGHSVSGFHHLRCILWPRCIAFFSSFILHFSPGTMYTYIYFHFSLSFFIIIIADAPVCGSTHEELLGALKHETLTLKCEVDASPPADSFHWTFNSSGEPTDLPARLHSSEVWPIVTVLFPSFFLVSIFTFFRTPTKKK